jgi:hypothetical protein
MGGRGAAEKSKRDSAQNGALPLDENGQIPGQTTIDDTLNGASLTDATEADDHLDALAATITDALASEPADDILARLANGDVSAP